MPQNRDDNARGYSRDSRDTDSRNESLYGDTPDVFRGIFDSYASFLKDYYGDRGRISSGAPSANSVIEFARELQRHPVEGAEGPPTDASGPPTGEETHTLEGDPKSDG